MSAVASPIEQIVQASAASAEFKAAFQGLASHQQHPAIQANRGCPPVKLQRLLTKLMESEPGLAIERVEVDGRSGCSDFAGTLKVNGDEAIFDFVWDCAWRAKKEGFVDHFGYPDQIRAAREFGYQCFERFTRR